jgi:hypothetical protein
LSVLDARSLSPVFGRRDGYAGYGLCDAKGTGKIVMTERTWFGVVVVANLGCSPCTPLPGYAIDWLVRATWAVPWLFEMRANVMSAAVAGLEAGLLALNLVATRRFVNTILLEKGSRRWEAIAFGVVTLVGIAFAMAVLALFIFLWVQGD